MILKEITIILTNVGFLNDLSFLFYIEDITQNDEINPVVEQNLETR